VARQGQREKDLEATPGLRDTPFMKLRHKTWVIEPILLLVAFLAIIRLGIGKAQTAPFHIDEAHKIAETYYYHLFFVDHDVANPAWHEDFYARMNPPVAKYIMGANLALHREAVLDLSLQQKFEQFWKTPQYLREQIPRSLLLHARSVSVVFAALTLVLLYLIGRLLGSPLVGILGALLLACHPIFRYHATIALTDSILTFFMTAMVPATVMTVDLLLSKDVAAPATTLRSRRGGRMVACVALTAVIGAAAAGTKLNGVLAAVFFAVSMFAGLLLEPARSQGARRPWLAAKMAAVTAASLGLALILFVGINPYLYNAPVSRLLSTLRVQGDWMLKQALDPGQPLWTAVQKISAIGVYDFALPQSFFFKTGAPLLFIVFSMGVLCMVVDVLKAQATRRVCVCKVTVLVWMIVYGFGVGAWIPVTWDRYFLPLAPFIALISGYGIVAIFKTLRVLSGRVRFPRKGRKRIGGCALALGAALPMSLAIWYGVMDRSLLPPGVLLLNHGDAGAILGQYERASLRRAGNPLRMLYTADMKRSLRDPAGAASLYVQALGLLDDQPQRVEARIMEAIGRLGLAEAYYQMSRYSDAATMLESHLNALRNIKGTLRSNDPKVLEEFDRTIQEREQFLRDLQRKKS
jgi:hypothetical protein